MAMPVHPGGCAEIIAMSDNAAFGADVLLLGLTGGIGAGKSTVAEKLVELGATVIDADRLSREVVAAGTPGLRAVHAEFGEGVLRGDGLLDRRRLGELVFADHNARDRLNAIVHPLVRTRTAETVAAAPAGSVVVHDVPLLIENDMAAGYHLVIAVLADEHHRLDRLASRGLSAEQARARMDSQVSDERRLEVADIVIDNNGSPQRTLQQVEQLWLRRILPFRDNIVAHRPAELPSELQPYDPQWPQRYERAVTRLTTALSSRLISLEHVGATAVSGSRSHDVVDIRVWVTQGADVASRLERHGWFPIGVDWRVPRFASADSRDYAVLFVHSGANG